MKTGKLLVLLMVAVLLLLTACNEEQKPFIATDIVNGSVGLQYIYIPDKDAYAVCGIGECTDAEVRIAELVNQKPVIAVAEKAFFGNENILSVHIPDSVEAIGRDAFSNCTNTGFTSITIGTKDSNLKGLGLRLFHTTFVSTIYYKGTMAEWKSLEFETTEGQSWNYNWDVPVTVVCDDGELYYSNDDPSNPPIANPSNPSGEVTYTVTKKQWDENMNAKNFTISLNLPGVPEQIKQTDYALDGYNYDGGEYEHIYYVIKDDIVYGVIKEEGQWVGYPNVVEWYPMPWIYYVAGGSYEELINILNFDNFTFDESRQVYTSTPNEGFEAVATFQNGKLVSLESIDKNDSSNYIKIEFSNIGTTIVNVPDFVIQGEGSGEETDKKASEGLEYTLNDDGSSYSVTGIGSCTDTDLVIPSTYNELSVVTIGDYAFCFCYSLNGVVIPDSVTTIGDSAFSSCYSLTSVEIGNSVNTIGDLAFAECSLTSVVIPDSVTTIGSGAFSFCYSLNSVVIPNSVTIIRDSAFESCNSLTSVEIPDSVTTIGMGAFYGCDSLTSVEIPDSVTTIGAGAFSACDSLTGIWVDTVNPAYGSDKQGVLFNKDKTILITTPATIKGVYVIPDSVTTIGDHAFAYCDSLTSVEIPDSVTTIGEDAFAHCDSLTNIVIPDSVTTIGDYAFYSCYSLTNIVIPDSVTTIGDHAFHSCYSLTNIVIPDSVTTIGDWAFAHCYSLTSVVIPDSVTTIGDHAFHSCDSLTNITFAGTVTQWENINFGDGWNYLVPATEVICSDGKVSLN